MIIQLLDKIEKLQPHFKNHTESRNTNRKFQMQDQPGYLFSDWNSLFFI